MSDDELRKLGFTVGPTAAAGMAKLLAESATATPTAPAQAKPRPPARARLIIDLPGVIVRSEANIRGKARSYIERKAAIKTAVREALPEAWKNAQWLFGKPVRVKFTRISRKILDDDNLHSAFKVTRDCVAEWLEVDDGDRAAVRWKYRQKAGYVPGIRIEIR